MRSLVFLALLLSAARAQNCLSQGLMLLGDCDEEQAYISAAFPLNATAPLTPEQLAAFEQGVPAGLPRPSCCQTAKAFASPPGVCHCSAALAGALPAATATPFGLQGVVAVASKLCMFTAQTC